MVRVLSERSTVEIKPSAVIIRIATSFKQGLFMAAQKISLERLPVTNVVARTTSAALMFLLVACRNQTAPIPTIKDLQAEEQRAADRVKPRSRGAMITRRSGTLATSLSGLHNT
jgi:hypothetical protein